MEENALFIFIFVLSLAVVDIVSLKKKLLSIPPVRGGGGICQKGKHCRRDKHFFFFFVRVFFVT